FIYIVSVQSRTSNCSFKKFAPRLFENSIWNPMRKFFTHSLLPSGSESSDTPDCYGDGYSCDFACGVCARIIVNGSLVKISKDLVAEKPRCSECYSVSETCGKI